MHVADKNSVLDLADLNATIDSVFDLGPGDYAVIEFKNGSSINVAFGDGTTDSIDDILDPATQIILSG